MFVLDRVAPRSLVSAADRSSHRCSENRRFLEPQGQIFESNTESVMRLLLFFSAARLCGLSRFLPYLRECWSQLAIYGDLIVRDYRASYFSNGIWAFEFSFEIKRSRWVRVPTLNFT